MTTPKESPMIAATKRTSTAYCELIDALDELKRIDQSLYLIALTELHNEIQKRARSHIPQALARIISEPKL